MRANPNEDLDSQYQNLTDKQQAVIDAYAQNPDETNREIARIAGEEILGEDGPVNESYASEITNDKYADLAEYRAEIEQNGRPQGQEQTIGDPFENLQQQQSHGVQSITERPVKQAQRREDDAGEEQATQVANVQKTQSVPPVQVVDTGDGIAIKLSYRYAQQILESPEQVLPDDIHQQLINVVFQGRFS